MFDYTAADRHFTAEEKLVLNQFAVDVDKDRCCELLSFSSSVSEDEDYVSLLQETSSKIQKLSDDEWINLQRFLPLGVPVSSFDSVDNAFSDFEV